jgi:hypothetical protein
MLSFLRHCHFVHHSSSSHSSRFILLATFFVSVNKLACLCSVFCDSVISFTIRSHLIHCFLFYRPPFSCRSVSWHVYAQFSATLQTFLTNSIFHFSSSHVIPFFLVLRPASSVQTRVFCKQGSTV